MIPRITALTAAACLLPALSAWAALPVWTVNFNMTTFQVNVLNNNELPFAPPIFQSDSLAIDPAGILYIANAAGAIFTIQGSVPIGPTGFTQIGDLDYASGGLWGFSNAASTLFFFDLTTTSVTYSLPITSGLGANTVTGVTQNPLTGDIYLSGNTGLNADSLFKVNASSNSASLVGSMVHGDVASYISDIEFDGSGNLLAMTWYHRDFYLVNPNTAGTSLISNGPHRDVTGLALGAVNLDGVPEGKTWAAGLVVALLAWCGRRKAQAS